MHRQSICGLPSMRSTERVVDDAVNETGFGKFNHKITLVCSLIIINSAVSINSVGFILPSAACDYQMTTEDKGNLSAAPLFGMLVGSYFWGCYAAVKGRRVTLLITLILHGTSELIASVMPFYWGFLFLKFISGAAVNGQISLSFLYVGEFQPTTHRNMLLGLIEVAWECGMITAAAISWLIIPLRVNYETTGFFFRSWNLFVLACSLPPLLISIWFYFFPETPKYLAETSQNKKLLEVLQKMFTQNTGRSLEEYKTILKTSANKSLADIVSRAERAEEKVEKQTFINMVKLVYSQTVTIVKPPYIKRTIIVCIATYFLMYCYYAITLWLPELFQRYATFENLYPNQSATVCTMKAPNTTIYVDNLDDECEIETSVYINTFIAGASCLLVSPAYPLLINRLGHRPFLAFTTIVPSIVTLCLFLVKTSLDNLILSSIFEAFTSVANAVVLCLIIDLYPTSLRSTAMGFTTFFSRLGAIVGNLMIGALINNYCTPFIIIVAVQLFLSGTLSLFAPEKYTEDDEIQTQEPKEDKPV